jgi:signal transduction histidine kinase
VALLPLAGPSRRLLALLLAITVVPLVSLLWLGHYLLEEDRRAADLQESQRIAAAAVKVVSAVDRAIAADEQRLAAMATDWPAGLVVVTIKGNRLEAMPPRRIAFYPVATPLLEPESRVFEPVDRAEFQFRDMPATLALLEPLAGSDDPAVRATARLRLARTLAASGDPDRALRLYEALTLSDGIGIGGVPIALVARFRRCQLLAELGRGAANTHEATLLHTDLVGGRWTLAPPVYALYLKDVDVWLDDAHLHPTEEERLASAVTQLWTNRDRFLMTGQTRFHLESAGRQYTVLARVQDGLAQALVASEDYVRPAWLAGAADVASENGVALNIAADAAPGGVQAGSPVPIRAAGSHLPWDVTVARTLSAAQPEATSRRALLMGGLAVLLLMALTCSYFIARAVHREIAVARLKSDFVATVSHEFRTPLTTLRQFTEILREGKAADDAQRQVCYDAQSRATDRLTRLVETVLDFGRMQADKRPYVFETVSVNSVVRSVVDTFRQDASAVGFTIELGEMTDAAVSADIEALGRAIRNLLENAVKYSPTERTVTVSAERRSRDVLIAVRDRGIGIAPHERRAVFDQFHRGAEAAKRGITGTGIGLAMVDHIVRGHRGRVDIESEPGKGSTFTIVLPVAATEAVAMGVRVIG